MLLQTLWAGGKTCHPTWRTTSVARVNLSYSGFQWPSQRSYLRRGLTLSPRDSCPASQETSHHLLLMHPNGLINALHCHKVWLSIASA